MLHSDSMQRRTSLYKNLWIRSAAEGKERSVAQKRIDDLCQRADFCESVDDYVYTLCEGMQALINKGIQKEHVLNHSILLSKLLRLGEDVMETARRKSNLFYIGLFIDLRISANWFQKAFYALIQNLIEQIVRRARQLPERLKARLILLAKQENHNLYVALCRDGPFQPAKKVA